MAFVFPNQNPKVWWPIKIGVPVDGGQFETQTMSAQFEILPKEEIDAHQKRISDLMGDGGDYTLDFAQDILGRVVLDWKGVSSHDGAPLDFSQADLKRMLSIPFIKTAFWAAYSEAVSGRRAKN